MTTQESCPELEAFANSNGFGGCFRTSAKTGFNIDKAMECIIKNIVQRMEAVQKKGKDYFSEQGNNVILERERYNENGAVRKQQNQGCC